MAVANWDCIFSDLWVLSLCVVSQEEALQAFIQPETLDGPNQYFCERCKKKCDARKVSSTSGDWSFPLL